MDHGPSSEANSSSASKNSPHFWNPKVHLRVNNSPPHIHTLSLMVPVHAPILFLEDLFYYYPLIYAYVFQVGSFPRFPHANN